MAKVVRTMRATAYTFGRGVSGHISYRQSAFLPDAKCHCKGHLDDASQGIYLPDEECQSIILTDRAYVLQTQSVTANGVRIT